MINFLIKGIIRDKNRSLLPIIIVAIGVSLTVFLSGYMAGVFNDIIRQNAKYDTGHLKIMTKAYADNKSQLPNDLALLGVNSLSDQLEREFPNVEWVKRIKFGGLLDVPDDNGNTKGQGPALGMGINIFSEENNEVSRLNLEDAIIKGEIPRQNGQALIAHEFAEKLNIKVGDEITYVGATMYGSMSFHNFTVSGTIRFGVAAMERGALVIDISDAQQILDMQDGASEILGYFNSDNYNANQAHEIKSEFNRHLSHSNDEFAPEMFTLEDQNNLGQMLSFSEYMSQIIVLILILAMSVVLWNTGLLGGLRRYKEYGIRLALGESKGRIYRASIMEAIIIGMIGSSIGTIIGLIATYYMQEVGIDISEMMGQSSMMIPGTLRSKMTVSQFYIGFIPGVGAMVFGNMLSGIGIYKRETATLFKELEV